MLSKAFWKSTKLTNIWSTHSLPLQNPACSSLSCLSIASVILWMIILAMILLGIDKRVIPRQLLQSLRAPFLVSLIIMPFVQLSGITFPSHIDIKNYWRISAVSSGSTLDFPFFSSFIVCLVGQYQYIIYRQLNLIL